MGGRLYSSTKCEFVASGVLREGSLVWITPDVRICSGQLCLLTVADARPAVLHRVDSLGVVSCNGGDPKGEWGWVCR